MVEEEECLEKQIVQKVEDLTAELKQLTQELNVPEFKVLLLVFFLFFFQYFYSKILYFKCALCAPLLPDHILNLFVTLFSTIMQ